MAIFFLMVVMVMLVTVLTMVFVVGVALTVMVMVVVPVAVTMMVLFVVPVALALVVFMMMFIHIWCVFLMQRYGMVSATGLQMSRGQRRRRSRAEVSQVCKKRRTCDVLLLLRPICVAGDAKNTDLRRYGPPPATKMPGTCDGNTLAEVPGQ